jgi:hypothetical protein
MVPAECQNAQPRMSKPMEEHAGRARKEVSEWSNRQGGEQRRLSTWQHCKVLFPVCCVDESMLLLLQQL